MTWKPSSVETNVLKINAIATPLVQQGPTTQEILDEMIRRQLAMAQQATQARQVTSETIGNPLPPPTDAANVTRMRRLAFG